MENQTDEKDSPTTPVNHSQTKSSRSPVLTVGLVVIAILIVGLIIGLIAKHNNNNKNAVYATSYSKIASPKVDITTSEFVPATISIKVGQSVTWVNTDSKSHWIASDPYPTDNTLADLNSRQAITTGDSYSFIFDTAGTYKYHDNLHPSIEGTVIVK